MGFLLHPSFGGKIRWAVMATKQTLRGKAGSCSGLLHRCRTQLPHPFPSISTAFSQEWHKRKRLLETPQPEEFSYCFRALCVLLRHRPRCTLLSATHWRTSTHWQTLQLVLIHECSLPFLVLLLLFYGQGEGRTEILFFRNNGFSAISAVIWNILICTHLMSHHCDFWLQYWSSDSQAPSFTHQADIILDQNIQQ